MRQQMKRVYINWCLRALDFKKLVMMINNISNKMKSKNYLSFVLLLEAQMFTIKWCSVVCCGVV